MLSSSRRGFSAVVGAATLAMVVLLAGCGSSSRSVETVRIGVDLELTGPGGPQAQVFRQALELRVNQLNEDGVLGNRRLELVVLDNRSDDAVATSNVERLASDPKVVAIVTGACEPCIMAAQQTIANSRIPVISLGSATELVEPIADRRYVFKLGPDAFDVASVLANELRRIGAESVGLIASDRRYGTEGQDELSAAAERIGVAFVPGPAVGDDGAGVEAAVAEVLDESEPDAVVIWTSGAASVAAAVQLRQQGYTGELLLAPSTADEVFIGAGAREALADARMVFTESLVIDGLIASSPARAARRTWLRDYSAAQGSYHAQSALAADAVQVIAAAINRYDSTDREQVRSALENTQIDGFTGPIRFRIETHSGLSQQALVMLVVQGDRWRLAGS